MLGYHPRLCGTEFKRPSAAPHNVLGYIVRQRSLRIQQTLAPFINIRFSDTRISIMLPKTVLVYGLALLLSSSFALPNPAAENATALIELERRVSGSIAFTHQYTPIIPRIPNQMTSTNIELPTGDIPGWEETDGNELKDPASRYVTKITVRGVSS